MINKRTLIISLLLTLSPLWIHSQDAPDIEKTMIMSYAESDDPVLHFKALESIRKRSEKMDQLDRDCMKIVVAMATSSIITEIYEDGIKIETNKEVQIEAIRLLGFLGGQDSLDALSSLLILSRDYELRYEAVSSSAHVKADDYDAFLEALVDAMKNQHYTNMDNGFAYASLYTVDSLMTDYGILPTKAIIDVILIYRENAYMHKVQDYALAILKRLF